MAQGKRRTVSQIQEPGHNKENHGTTHRIASNYIQWSRVTLGPITALRRGCGRGFDLLAQHREADSRLPQRRHVVAYAPSNMRVGECLDDQDVW